MIETLWITNPNGDSLELNLRSSESDHGLLLFNITGLGSPKATISESGGPPRDGIRAGFVRTDARHLLMTITITAREDDEEIARKKVYDFFPIKQEITFRLATKSKDVYIPAIVESIEMNEFAKIENAVISLFCAEPWFLETQQQNLSIPNSIETLIPYYGDVSTGVYMVITLLGYMSSITITNNNGSQSMTIDLSIVQSSGDPGDIIYLDTRFAQKSCLHYRSYTYTNLLPGIGLNDDWLKLYTGDNNIEITANSAAPNPDANSPGITDLVAFFPLSERSLFGATNLQSGEVFNRHGIIGDDIGHIYDTARKFDPANKAYFSNDAASSAFNPTGDIMITFWAKVGSYGEDRNIISAIGNNGFYVITTSGGNLQFGVRKDNVTKYQDVGMASVGVWEFYAVWYDVSAQWLWVQKASDAPIVEITVPAPSTYTQPCYIGGLSDGTLPFDGQIEALTLWNNVLTEAQIDFLYNSGAGRKYSELLGLIDPIIQFNTLFQGV